MATEPTVIRRYTPPTCALEIAAQQSPLSRWMGKTALKDLRFKLSFDDPRVSDDEWIVLRGDQTQLEELNETVSNYVQSFLNRVTPNLAASTATIEKDIAAETAIAATELAAPMTAMAMQPKGLLSHELTLGSLATEQSGEKITFSSTQLSDLSAALDEYSAEATTLPQLQNQKVAWLPNPTQWSSPNWAGLAAGMLVFVGLGVSLANGLGGRSTSSDTASQASSSDQRLAVQPPTTTASPTPDPFSTLPPLAALPGTTTLPVPSPGANSGLNLPNLGANSKTAKTQTSPSVIANVPSGVKPPSGAKPAIVDIPQPSKPTIKITPQPTAPKTAATAPVPPIIDNIGSETPVVATAPVEAIPDQTQLKAGQAKARQTAKPNSTAGARRGRSADLSMTESASALPSLEPAAPPAAAAAAKQDREFFDNRNVQAAAVRRYFKQRWQPPKDLKQSVQYDIELNPNGSLKRADAVGSEADRLRSQAGVPAAGSPIAPAAKDGKSSRVRVLLEQDGAVQAFPQ
ncbi:DUF4335 domain-containing protein [filamentous cyanobacterium LEGE 11480]|uniref:DUF4335 domain-containing protein n=1 Tax=Romeriopsis navalis LEGE 11480 TaxID=2777977 RepID=A0A928Z4U3_9CYAN|nr:DUF4335 domain-containing protein [Romeriopsis navalis]MBE9030560.1 DUF4335 domain-containing protein [Romeriopsis navalis LEGE 11480]